MKDYEYVLNYIEKRRQNIIDGKVNCIPFGLPRFQVFCPGIEQKKFYCVTANSKVGKTQLADALFLYNTVFYAKEHPDQVRVKIFYFSLEMSKEEKYMQLMCHLLYRLSKGKVRVDPTNLSSTSKPVDEEVIKILESEEYKEYFEFFEEHVEIITSIRNPFGIYKHVREYARANGEIVTKTIDTVNKKTGEITDTKKVFDKYIPNDPDEYVIIIMDHCALFTQENGKTLQQTIAHCSSDYCINLRDNYGYIPVFVQQQAAAQESNDNIKLNRLRPTLDGLGDVKITQRDFNMILGLFSPHRHEIKEYKGYDITKFGDNIRFLELIASRSGGGGTLCPLFFDGGTNFFRELPLPDNMIALNKVINKGVNRARNPKEIISN